MTKRARNLLAACFVCSLAAAQASAAVTVILVRHAEKAAAPAADPPLTPEGAQRAETLATMLRNASVTAIFHSEYLRTEQTAAPLAKLSNVKPTRIEAKKSAELVQAIRAISQGVVVVVGHSNTIPEVLAGLGGPKISIPETDYDSLFLLFLADAEPGYLRLQFGDPSKPAAEQSGPMLAPLKK